MINSIAYFAEDFEKTLFSKKENRKEMLYLLDEYVGFSKHQRMSEDAVAAVLEEAVQTSYRRGGNNICPYAAISKEAVKDIIHNLKFPAGYKKLKTRGLWKHYILMRMKIMPHFSSRRKKGI